MGQLENMQLFTRIVESGSFTGAAEQLGLAKSAVSKRLSDLEAHLGAKLINRTTRTSSLTEAGNIYYQRAKRVLEEVSELNEQLSARACALSGVLKLAAPLSFGLAHLSPAIDLFIKEHPKLKVDIDFSDRHVDIIKEHFDLAFRIGRMQDSSMRARKIVSVRRVVCASPDYIKQFGKPETPEQLNDHKILAYRGSSSEPMVFRDQNKTEFKIRLNASMSANNGDFLKAMAMAGHGITIQPTFILWEALATRTLVPVLEDYSLPELYAHALYPPTHYLPLKVRMLIDFLIERFGDNPYWDQL